MKIKDKILCAIKKIEQRNLLNDKETAGIVDIVYDAFKEEHRSLFDVVRGITENKDVWYNHQQEISNFINTAKLEKKVFLFSEQESSPLMQKIVEKVAEKILSDD